MPEKLVYTVAEVAALTGLSRRVHSSRMTPEESEPVSSKADDTENRPRKTRRPVLLWICFGVALVSIGLSAFAGIMLWRLSTKVDDLSFGQEVTDYNAANDLLTPDVGVIQFMKRGYTVTFDSLSYTANGLEVRGTIGNPTQLNLSSINLKLDARPFPYQVKDKLKKDPFFFYVTDGFDIGSAQTTIFFLGAGKTESFTMTIPNVKQTKDGFQIAVSFSGERYSYLP
ncbi:MAG: hypothetical protein RB191_20540 [Terriglobia bacterium]|nr:hypothetical protein [Terriglobia bacterium]